jgi:RNA polymerase sigma-70 factor (ECF subfamily)
MRVHQRYFQAPIQTFYPLPPSNGLNGDNGGMHVGTVQMLQAADTGDAAAEPAALIAAAAAGDLPAFEQLYRQFSPRIYGLCLRLTGQREAAEDCTQDCFVAAWRSLGGFEQRSRFSTWLHRIAVHAVLARRRGLRTRYEVAEPPAGLPEVPDPAGDAPPLDLERAIAQLPEGARHVLVLVGVCGFSHAEAAEALGIAAGTCKAQLHRARSLVCAMLGLEES